VQEGTLADSIQRPLSMPRVVILRQDPFEHAVRESSMYFRWYGDKLRMFVPAQAVVGQRLASFELDQVLEQLQKPAGIDGFGNSP
jgi:arylsulfatase